MTQSPYTLPPDLPVPIDDGACLHLRHQRLPSVTLSTSSGDEVSFADLAKSTRGSRGVVLFFYPRTGIPGQPPNVGFKGESWDSIPGARGCTPQSCGFRDLFDRFQNLGVSVFGVSTNTPEHQREFRARNHIPFELLSDRDLRLVRTMRLPTFEFPVESGGPSTLIRRMAWFVSPDSSGVPRIRKVWYPAFPPDANAQTVVDWLERRSHIAIRDVTPADAVFVQTELRRNWNGSEIWSLRRPYAADQLPALIAMLDEEPVGLLTFTAPRRGEACEVITLSTRLESRGIGSELLQVAADIARAAGASRIFLTTSNDNTRAIGFYQREGWDLAALHRDNIDESRRHSPGIARVGNHGIPIRHELELELRLTDP